jgi:hypothetical protein
MGKTLKTAIWVVDHRSGPNKSGALPALAGNDTCSIQPTGPVA